MKLPSREYKWTTMKGLKYNLTNNQQWVRNYVLKKARQMVMKQTSGLYPAPLKIMEVSTLASTFVCGLIFEKGHFNKKFSSVHTCHGTMVHLHVPRGQGLSKVYQLHVPRTIQISSRQFSSIHICHGTMVHLHVPRGQGLSKVYQLHAHMYHRSVSDSSVSFTFVMEPYWTILVHLPSFLTLALFSSVLTQFAIVMELFGSDWYKITLNWLSYLPVYMYI